MLCCCNIKELRRLQRREGDLADGLKSVSLKLSHGEWENKICGFETFRVKMLYICTNSLSTKHYNRREK